MLQVFSFAASFSRLNFPCVICKINKVDIAKKYNEYEYRCEDDLELWAEKAKQGYEQSKKDGQTMTALSGMKGTCELVKSWSSFQLSCDCFQSSLINFINFQASNTILVDPTEQNNWCDARYWLDDIHSVLKIDYSIIFIVNITSLEIVSDLLTDYGVAQFGIISLLRFAERCQTVAFTIDKFNQRLKEAKFGRSDCSNSLAIMLLFAITNWQRTFQ